MADIERTYTIRLIIAGDGACGKTLLLCAYIGKEISENYVPTVLDTYTTKVSIGLTEVKVEIFDTAGQEDLDMIRKLAYQEAHCVILCYSVIARRSLENIKFFWVPELKEIIPKTPVVLCGNKLDMKKTKPAQFQDPKHVKNVVRKFRKIRGMFQCSALDEMLHPSKYTPESSSVHLTFKTAIKYGLEYKINGAQRVLNCNLL